MKIAIKKIGASKKNFERVIEIEGANLAFCGDFYKMSNGLIKIQAQIKGQIELCDDLSGENYISEISRETEFFVSDGIFKEAQGEGEYLDVIESFDGFLDLDSIFFGEIESIKLEYHTQH